MAIVHDNGYIKNNYVSNNNPEENIEIKKFRTKEHVSQKCKSLLLLFLPHV